MDPETIGLFCEKLRQMERDLSCCFKIETECCGVSMAQYHSLFEIAKQEQPSLAEVAAGLGLDTSTLSLMVNNLVILGLVNRVLNPEDRRYVSLTLTDQGKKVCHEIESSISNYIEKIFKAIPPEKQSQVVESIALLTNAVGRCGGQWDCDPAIAKLRME